jgi:hypothetical protein
MFCDFLILISLILFSFSLLFGLFFIVIFKNVKILKMLKYENFIMFKNLKFTQILNFFVLI